MARRQQPQMMERAYLVTTKGPHRKAGGEEGHVHRWFQSFVLVACRHTPMVPLRR